MLETYRYLLSKPPTEVDSLIYKAFSSPPAPIQPPTPVASGAPPPQSYPPGYHQATVSEQIRVDSVVYKRPGKPNTKGLTQVIIKCAREVKSADLNGKSDPYCKIIIDGEQTYKTRVKHETLNPDWDYVITLPGGKNSAVFDIEVWDKDVVGKDFLGYVNFTLDLTKNSNTWFDLGKRPNKKDKGITGKLQIIVEG